MNGTFGGIDPNGDWKLYAVDDGALDANRYQGGWTLQITAGNTPALSINGVSLNEGNTGTTSFSFTVTLSAASTQAVTFDFATAGGTANAGSDYTANAGPLTFARNETTKQASSSHPKPPPLRSSA